MPSLRNRFPYLENDPVLDFLELGFRNNILGVTAVQVGNDAHALLVAININQPPGGVPPTSDPTKRGWKNKRTEGSPASQASRPPELRR